MLWYTHARGGPCSTYSSDKLTLHTLPLQMGRWTPRQKLAAECSQDLGLQKEKKGSRIGQRDKLACVAVTTKNSAIAGEILKLRCPQGQGNEVYTLY